jgi:SAM-dependent methyltransferase
MKVVSVPNLRAETDDQAMTIRSTWDAAAAGWDVNGPRIRNWLSGSTEALLDAADIQKGDRVLDIAAGAGDQTIDIAYRVGLTGQVIAVDVSPEFVGRAQINLMRAGCKNAEVRIGNGEALGFNAEFDAAVCRLGLMFYADPLAGLTEMHRALKPGSRAAVLVFSGPTQNPLIVEQLSIAARHAGSTPPDPCLPGGLLSLGDPVRLTKLFQRAGFGSVDCRTIAAPMTLPTARDYVDFLRTAAGPIVQIASGLSNPQRSALWRDLERAFSRFQYIDTWIGDNELLLVSGSAEA